jgi:signal transduction histidine kinase
MAAVAALAAAALAIALVVRERMWRRTVMALRVRLAERANELREHERHASLTQVMSGLAQDLKSPLQGVLGNTELMLASSALHPASADDLREIQENAARAAGIVRHLLAFTETHTLTRRWRDINDVAAHAVDAARNELGAARVRVTFALADRLPLIYVDGRQLEKVISTLLSQPAGARRDGARGGASVTLATRLSASGDRLIVDLDDPTSAEFDPPTWSGDLAACRQIVQAHGGTLEVVRGGGTGFRFQLELPVGAAGAEPAAT